MRVEIVNRNETGFEHYCLIPTIELINEMQYDGWYETSIGITFLNISIWMVW